MLYVCEKKNQKRQGIRFTSRILARREKEEEKTRMRVQFSRATSLASSVPPEGKSTAQCALLLLRS